MGGGLEEGRVLGARGADAGEDGWSTPHAAGPARDRPGVLRPDLTVLSDGQPIGVTTSGTFSPTLKTGIALALLDTAAQIPDGASVVVDVRGREIECEVVKPPFVDVNVG